MQAADGNFYGTTSGYEAIGTVFKVTQNGTLITLHVFDNSEGYVPSSGALIQGPDGNLYGTTVAGGDDGEGTIFKITLGGTLTRVLPAGSCCSRDRRKFLRNSKSRGLPMAALGRLELFFKLLLQGR